MKNYEKYADEIREFITDTSSDWCELFAKPKVLKSLGKTCEDVYCSYCSALAMIWLLEDYEEPKEPEIDWSKVEVDTPILVRDTEDEQWERRYFAKYENKTIYAWDVGRTSWSGESVTEWEYAKLAESEEGGVE